MLMIIATVYVFMTIVLSSIIIKYKKLFYIVETPKENKYIITWCLFWPMWVIVIAGMLISTFFLSVSLKIVKLISNK